MSQVFSAPGELIAQDKQSLVKSAIKKIGIVVLLMVLQEIVKPFAPDISAWLMSHHIGASGASVVLAIDWVVKLIEKRQSATTYLIPNQSE